MRVAGPATEQIYPDDFEKSPGGAKPGRSRRANGRPEARLETFFRLLEC